MSFREKFGFEDKPINQTWTKRSQYKKSSTKSFVIGFFLFLFLFAVIAAFVVLKIYDFDLSKMFSGTSSAKETTAQKAQEVKPVLPKISGKANFLVAVTSDDGNSVDGFVIIHADMDKQKFAVCSLPAQTVTNVSGHQDTLFGQMNYGGMSQTVSAVNQLCGIQIDRYVKISEKNFKSAVKTLDGLVFTVDRDITYKSGDDNVYVAGGKQTMTGDMIVDLMNYSGWTEGRQKQFDIQAKLAAAMLDQYINKENVLKGEKLFKELINMTDSNISITDFKNNETCLEVLVQSGSRKPTSVIGTTGTFKKDTAEKFYISKTSTDEISKAFAK